MGMFDKLFDNKRMHWRVRQADRGIKRLKWELKRAFNHGNLEKVDKFSMVVVGRNDNYGGDFSDRLKATIDWNYNHVPGCELIYIEWNRIDDRPSDTEWISKRYPNSKCFIVPTSIHQLYSTNPKIPMMEYFAKNMGIREASNDWVFLINADVFLGANTISRLNKLNRSKVYGTHYVNIKWENDPISKKYFDDSKYELSRFSTNNTLDSVVGNFILTHKDNWMKATGYDERKTDVRDGVDFNGLMQLLHLGLETMVLGDHYHLDHQESRIYGYNDTHGDASERMKLLDLSNIPYKNNENWGLRNYSKKLIAERVWELQAI
jgi:hypothetical protein